MNNREIDQAWRYHNGTKHSYLSVRNNPHYLDWSNQPRPYKVYSNLESIPLPKPEINRGRPALLMVLGQSANSESQMCLRDLATLLELSSGISRRRRTSTGGEFFFRAAACTGALYEIEQYVVCGDLEDLAAGVYLFSPYDSSLKVIRRGDFRGVLVHATAREPSIMTADATIVCTGTYWRNSWKYQARTYRHFGWDNGTIIANLFALATARSLPAKLLNGFVDSEVNHLLDLDTEREVALNLITLGSWSTFPPDPPAEIPKLELETAPYSQFEVDQPAMREVHAASSLENSEEVASWRGIPPHTTYPRTSNQRFRLLPIPGGDEPMETLERVILRRGSSRQFARESITFQQLSTALACATAPLAADFLEKWSATLVDLYVVAHAVDDLQPGAYFLDREAQKLELLNEGQFRDTTGYLGLEQMLPADCAAAVFFLADLNSILNRYGNRGYRATQVEAGIRGGRLYLAAYAQHFGATGLTFYDDEVTRFFSPHAEGKSAIFLVTLGKKAK